MRHKNLVHFSRIVHVRVWMHELYLERCYGVYVPRLGGWA